MSGGKGSTEETLTREDLVSELAATRKRLSELNVLELRHQSRDEILRAVVHGTAAAGVDFFRALVRQLATTLQVRYAFVAECLNPEGTAVRAIAFWIGSEFGKTFEYTVAGTPCEAVLAGRLCHFPQDVQSLFPMDADLVALGAESYIGVPIFDSRGGLLGHLAVLHDRDIPEPLAEQARDLLTLFSARASVELERKAREDELRSVVVQLRDALAKVKTLTGLLPICAWCRKVRDDDGYWTQLELYVMQHSDAQFTHGICPDCGTRDASVQ